MAQSEVFTHNPFQSSGLSFSRLHGGQPIIQADPHGWDNRFTLNPTSLYLERSEVNDRLIRNILGQECFTDPSLSHGVVIVYYRGVSQDVPGFPSCRSSVGMAIFTPELVLLKRLDEPVLCPTDDPWGFDFNGVEDQRITRIGDTFYLVYCGFVRRPNGRASVQVCMAESTDLVNWTKLGPLKGDVNRCANKDAVLMAEPVNGRYIMFHRPCCGCQSDFSVSLAVSDSPMGEWKDCGRVMSAVRHPRYAESWVGMGSAPIKIEEGIYLADYHTGNYLPSMARDYFANYAVLNFNNLDLNRPASIVESRCEAVLFPETPYEVNSPWPGAGNLNCVFPCGSYEFNGDLYLVYGGADAYVLAAKVNKDELIQFSNQANKCPSSHLWACSHML